MLAQAQLDKEQFLWTDGAVRIVFSVMILIGFLYLTCIHVSFCLAQVAPAITPTSGVGDLGTIVTSSGNVHTITGGTRPAGEGNLFHSFAEFGVLTNITANFLNETLTPTSNILVRVTGGNISNIFGTIQTTDFGTANLFLMNPAGFLFGPTAAVNVGGMVAFTSADYLRLTDNSRFNAIPSAAADALLSRTPVAAFGFLGSNPGAITVQGSQLAVDTGQTLSLIGGNITLKAAELLAPRGQINLASIPSSGEIPSQIANLSPITNGSGATGTIQVSDQSVLDVSDGGGGTVTIRGGRFVLSDSMIFANVLGPAEATPGKGIDIAVAQDAVIQNGSILDTSIFADATPGVKYGGVTIRADRIEILRAQGASETAIFSDVLGSAGGDSGDILLTAGSILMRGTETSRPRLSAGTEESAGNAGKITLDTIGNLEIDRGTIISNVFLSSGDAGNIALSSAYGDILMTRAIVTSQTDQGKGNTGNIKVSAPEGDILLGDTSQLFTATRGTGAGGQLDIIANNLEMTGGSSITDDNLGSIQPGSVNVTLSGKLTLRGGSRIEPVSRSFVGAPAADFNITAKDILITGAGSKLSSETFRAGQGGNLNILSETVQLTNGGQIRSGSTIQPVPPAPQREIPTGAGGTITIQGLSSPATSVLIDGAGSGIFTTAEGTGAGGTIHLSTQALTLQNGGAISAATSGSAPSATGGTIVISATDQVTITSGGSISASSTGPGNAGNIKINAGQQFEMRDSSITTQATRASGEISTFKQLISYAWSTARSARRSRVALQQPAAISQSIRMSWSYKTAR